MQLAGFVGYSGSGKTTLMEAVIAQLRAAGKTVSTIKHAHHRVDLDQPGKDSWRHRKAGSYEVLLASENRLVLQREYSQPQEPRVQDLLKHLAEVDWVLFGGFKDANLPKIEVWRAEFDRPPSYPNDPNVVALVSDRFDRLPVATEITRLSINDPQSVTDFLLMNAQRFTHRPDAPVC